MKLKFQKTPRCEITGKPATYFVHQGPKGPATRAKVAESKEGEPSIKFLQPSEISGGMVRDEESDCLIARRRAVHRGPSLKRVVRRVGSLRLPIFIATLRAA